MICSKCIAHTKDNLPKKYQKDGLGICVRYACITTDEESHEVCNE